MRLLVISWEYPPNVVGGIGKHVAEFVQAFVDVAARSCSPIHLDLLTPTVAARPIPNTFPTT